MDEISDLKCAFCEKIFQSVPIILPCGWIICKEHMTHSKANCIICKNHVINIEECLRVKNIEIKLLKYKLKERLDHLKSILEISKSGRKESENLVIEYFNTLEKNIEIHREEVIKAVNDHFDKIKSNLKQFESDYKNNAEKNIIDETKTKEFENKLNKFSNLECTYMDIKNPDLLIMKLKRNIKYVLFLEHELENSIVDYEKYKFIPSLISNLEEICGKIDIVDKSDNFNIISGLDKGIIKIWNIKESKCTKTLEGHSNYVSDLKLLTSEKLISSSYDSTIKIWDLKEGTCIKTLKGDGNCVNCIEVLNPTQVLSGSLDSSIKLWNIDEDEYYSKAFEGHLGGIYCMKVLPNNELVSGSIDATIKLWNINNQICIKTFVGHTHGVYCLYNLMDFRLLSGSADSTIKIWDINEGICIKTLNGHTSTVYCLEVTPESERLVSGSADKTIRIWNLDNYNCLKIFNGHTSTIFGLKCLPNDDLISCSYDGTIKLWNIYEEKCTKTIQVNQNGVFCLKLLINY